jgi:hypothetical protein
MHHQCFFPTTATPIYLEVVTMKTFTRTLIAALFMSASCALLSATPVYANEHGEHEGHAKEFCAQDHQAWEKKRIDKEAGMLEIKASQETAWEAYAAAKLDLAAFFGTMMKPVAAEELDAAATARKHAEHATEIAQKLAKVADATDKLQAVLSEDQRKVLNRISQHHEFHHHGFGHHEEHDGAQHQPKKTAKPVAKAVVEKAKQQ